jgi:RNA polymerase sigma factor (sigma-70 family)
VSPRTPFSSTLAPRRAESDERLVRRARAGDEAAFAAIVERYRPLLLRHCARITGEASAQDAVQQAFLSAWKQLHAGAEVHTLRPWLFTIAHNAALTSLRDRGADHAELPALLQGGRPADEDVAQAAEARAALRVVADLPPLERDALVATALHGASGRATATALGVSEAQVRQLVFRARTKLKAAGGYALIPPIFIVRWIARGRPRAGAAALSGAPNAASAIAVRIAAVAAAAALVSAPVVVLTDRGHGQLRTTTAAAAAPSTATAGASALLPATGRLANRLTPLPLPAPTRLTSAGTTVAQNTLGSAAASLSKPAQIAATARRALPAAGSVPALAPGTLSKLATPVLPGLPALPATPR